jgi:hypothetical protein
LKLHSYVVARDYGFAPNPFYGYCTLCTCKPVIRRTAKIGDWVVGTASRSKLKDGHLIYAMRVSEAMTYDKYWADERFQNKKPNLAGSLKQAFGDNIYHHMPQGWHQENSHHSHADGTANIRNINNDTKTNRVLISEEYVYYGANAPKIPNKFRNYNGVDICAGRGHQNNFPEKMVQDFIAWIKSRPEQGYSGRPLDW